MHIILATLTGKILQMELIMLIKRFPIEDIFL